jgi:hypothetical protein
MATIGASSISAIYCTLSEVDFHHRRIKYIENRQSLFSVKHKILYRL